MRASFVILALGAALVSAQTTIADYPSCALTCFSNANMGGCTMDDQACLCQSQDFLNSSTACVKQSCSADDAAKTAQVSSQLCAQAGVTVSFTTTPVSTGTMVSPSAAMSGMTMTMASGASKTMTSATSSKASATSSSNAGATNVAGSGALLAGLVAAAALAL